MAEWRGLTADLYILDEVANLLCEGCGRHIPCRHCRPLADEGPDCA